ncbi:helix-turn-helix domain-containing protein [Sphingobacterium faecale]|uniref:Helix-turn-helix domain-containing protein n=1 Tax=Sphingobacterium faecale TaxID=2803775 RepID=A0ABS1QYZ0_9SPHI|nr:helix-turn-helix domain-containing protein [Sphingobacterium faecale]MBL1407646.1 helix-turn-helix domain-containing protein [Sphingobacterium faecale]
MKKTFHFELPPVDHFEGDASGFLPKLADSTLQRYADDGIQLIEEYIDYHQVMLYRIQAILTSSYSLPLACDKADYHLVYPVKATAKVLIHRTAPHPSQACFVQGQASYIYIPKATVHIELRAGCYLVYGLLINIGIVREIIYREDHFLMLFRKHRDHNKKLLYQSDSWPIKDRTLFQISRIETVFFNFQKNNEGEVIKLVYAFFDIAEYKQFEVYEKLHEGKELAKKARLAIADQIHQTFSTLSIGQLHKQLGVGAPYLRRVHQKYYQQTLLQYRDELLLAKAKLLLVEYSVSEVSNFCGFHQLSSFSDYFLKYTDQRPAHYQKILSEKRKRQ